MAAIVGDRRLKPLLAVVACALLTAACSSTSYQEAALQASSDGDQAKAISLAQKEVDRYDTPDQCSRSTNTNCGTLALAYSSLAEYQILHGDKAAGENSFRSAKGALALTDPANKASATGMVFHDVSDAYWKAGDKARARAIFKEGSAAGGDSWLYMCAAAQDDAKAASKTAIASR